MHALNLFAYVLVISIYPVMAEVAINAGGTHPLVLACAQVMALCAFGICATPSIKELKKTCNDVTKPAKRVPFITLTLLSMATCICSSFAFQGSGQEGTGAIANLVDVVGTVIFAVLTAPYFERLLGQPHVDKRRAWVPLSVALVAVTGFVVDQRASAWRDVNVFDCFAQPEIVFAGLWALCGVLSMNLTRVYFSTDTKIQPAGFMACRSLLPSVCIGMLLLREVLRGTVLWENGGAAAIGVVSLGLSLVLAMWFQYRALREYSADSIARAQMLVPIVTYIVALTAKRANFSWTSLALAVAVAGGLWLTRSTKSADEDRTPGVASIFWNRWLLNAKFFVPGFLGFAGAGLILLPVVSTITASSDYVYFIAFTVPATALVLTLALVEMDPIV